jgi:hypothetical protein
LKQIVLYCGKPMLLFYCVGVGILSQFNNDDTLGKRLPESS